MPVSELNEDTQDQICDLLENLQQIEKHKIKTNMIKFAIFSKIFSK